MRELEKRLTALEERARAIPLKIDDATILGLVCGHRTDRSAIRPALEKLFEIVEPALLSSLTMGTDANEYCDTRGIRRPDPSGPMSLLAEINLYPYDDQVPENLARKFRALEREVEAWLFQADIESSTSLSGEQVRSYLITQLFKHRPAAINRRARPPMPTWTKSEADRVLRLVVLRGEVVPDDGGGCGPAK